MKEMELSTLEKLILTRRSIRRFQETAVPEDLLLKALELSTWAPNGGNYQPWRFLVITNRTLIRQMADAVRAKSELIASWPESNPHKETMDRWRKNSDFFRDAPTCVAVLANRSYGVADLVFEARAKHDSVAKEICSYRQLSSSRLLSVGAAITTLLLVLHSMGLAAVWMGSPQQCKGEIEELLYVSSDWDFISLIPVGYAAETPESPPRRPLSEVIQFFR